MGVEKVVAQIVAEVDDQSIKQAENDLKTFARDTKKELDKDFLLKLQIDKANLSLELEKAKALLNKAKKENDQASIIDMTIKVDTLKSNLTEAWRQLNNYKNTWDIALSRLQAKFNQVTEEIKKTRAELVNVWKSTSKLDSIAISLSEWKITADEAKKALENINNTNFSKITAWIQWLFKAFIWFEVLWTIKDFIVDSINYSANLEQISVSFENITWSATDAQKIIKDIQTLANNTPFEFSWLADWARLLMSVAWIWKDDVIPVLTALWDIAASQWKDIWQTVEAFNDAITWEFERLKEFGIRASSSGDKVTFTFKWQKTTVDKTTGAIQDYLLNLSEVQWVSWSMEKQSQTLNWKWSTLKDTIQSAWWVIADFFTPAIKQLISSLIAIISVFKIVWNWILWFAKLWVAWFTFLWESSYNIAKYIYNNWTIFTKNLQILFKNLGTNLGKAFDNLPWAVAVVLKNTLIKFDGFITSIGNAFGLDISKKLWLNKIIDTIDTATKWIWFVDLTAWFQELPKFNNDLKNTSTIFDSFLATSDDMAKNFDDIKKALTVSPSTPSTPNKTTVIPPIDDAKTNINNLETLRNKLKTAKDELEKLTIWSEAYKKKQKEIADLEKQIDDAEWKKATGSTKKKTDLEEEAQKKQVEMLERNKKYKDKLRDEEEKREEEKNKKLKNNLDALSDAYKEWWDIYGDVIDEAKDKSDEFSDKIKDLQEDIKDLNKDLADLESEKVKTLWERFVETWDKIKDLNKEIKDLKDSWINENIAQSIWLDTLRLMQSDSEIWWWKVSDLIKLLELQKELNDLKNEQILIQQNITDSQITEAQRVAWLSETAKYLEEFDIKKQKILDDKALKDQEILNLQTQKDAEAKIIEDFNNKKAQLDENYKNKVASIESQITDKTLLEVNKRLSFLEELRQKAIATAEAMRSAWVSTTTTTINNNPNVVVNANLTNDVDVNNLWNKLADKVSLSKKWID